VNDHVVVNSFACIICQNGWFYALKKVDLNSLRLFSPVENENVIVCDTMRILMQNVFKVRCIWNVLG